MSTEYSIYRFAKPTKQELSKIEFFEPYSMFPVYDADDEQTNEHICLFCCDDKDITNIINSKFARRVVLPEKATDYENLYRSMGFGEKEIAEKRVYLKSSDGYTMDYTDGMQLIRVAYNELKKYQIIVQTECVAIKMECLWNSEDVYCYPDKTRVYEQIRSIWRASALRAESEGLCPKTLDFWEAWLQIGCKKVLSICYQNDLNICNVNAAENSAAFFI